MSAALWFVGGLLVGLVVGFVVAVQIANRLTRPFN